MSSFARSGACTVVLTWAVLLGKSKSACAEVATAVLTAVPAMPGVTRRVAVRPADGARETLVIITVPPPIISDPCELLDDITVKPAGKLSVITTFVAVFGPRLVRAKE